MNLNHKKYNKSYKKLIISYIGMCLFLIFFISASRAAFKMGVFPAVLNIIFVILFIMNEKRFYDNYQFIIKNNYKRDTKISKKLVRFLMIITGCIAFICEIIMTELLFNNIF